MASGLAPQLAQRYVEHPLDPDHGLVAGGRVDAASLASVVDLRRRHLPAQVAALLEGAADPAYGLAGDGDRAKG